MDTKALVDEFNRWEPPKTGKTTMRELHGIVDAEKVQAVNDKGYTVSVEDGHGLVILSIAGMTYPAGLSPERARFLAECLVQSASRVEAKAPKLVKAGTHQN